MRWPWKNLQQPEKKCNFVGQKSHVSDRMKKTTALSLLLLANIILLAHSAIPHHQHEQASACCHCEARNDAQTCAHEKNPLPEKCCIIDHVYTPAHSNIKTTCHFHQKCHCGQVFYILVPNTFHTDHLIKSTKRPFRFKPCLRSFYHTGLIARSLGLRAPPLC